MRNEYKHQQAGRNGGANDQAGQRRAWRPGDQERRLAGHDDFWRDGGDEGPPFPRDEGTRKGPGSHGDGQTQRHWSQKGDDHRGPAGPYGEARDPYARGPNDVRHARLRPEYERSYSGPGDETADMDWSRSGSLRQDYGDYGHVMDDRRQAQQTQRRNPGNEPHPYAAWHQAQPAARKGRPPKGYTRSDERIREDVCEQLMADHYIDAGDVSVEVKAGVVTLSGSVSERNMRYALESVAASCLGVTDVENHVRVGDGRDTRLQPTSQNSSQHSGQHSSQPEDPHGSEAARTYSAAQNYARDNGKPGAASPSSSSAGLTNTSVSDTHGLGGDQSRFIRHDTD